MCQTQRHNGGKEKFAPLMSEVLIICLQGIKTKDVKPQGAIYTTEAR